MIKWWRRRKRRKMRERQRKNLGNQYPDLDWSDW